MQDDDSEDAGPGPDAADAAEAGVGDREFDRPLRELVQRAPVTCGPDEPLRSALERLRQERVGSIVVVDAEARPIGVVTLGDVLTRIALPQTPLDAPVRAVMTSPVHTAAAQAPAFEAALLMARENVRHVPLVENGRLAGVVSESRLFALWRRSIGAVRAGILEARSRDELAAAAAGLHALPGRLLAAGLTADAITTLLTALNDLIVTRLLEITGAAELLRGMNGCWMAVGSQGRCEQTLATDQDNAILFDDEGDPEERRRALLPVALEVNQALDACGFALCRGGIMASNPAWCLSLSEWRRRFSAWMDRPEAEGLLNATIFFDFRAVGNAQGAPQAQVAQLRAWLGHYARGNDRFLTLMVLHAQGNPPPLGVLRDFVLPRGGEHPHALDLKINGVQAFVESARVYALSCGVAATHTVERLEAAGAVRGIPPQETAAWCDAFRVLQRLRLGLNTRQQANGEALHNFLDPDTLNALDRNLLKEALRQARSLQSRLALDFSLGGTSVRA